MKSFLLNGYLYEIVEYNSLLVYNPLGIKYTIQIDKSEKCYCNCPGFFHRNTCKHVDWLKQKLNEDMNLRKEIGIQDSNLKVAEEVAADIRDYLLATNLCEIVTVAGSIRRMQQKVKDIDIVIAEVPGSFCAIELAKKSDKYKVFQSGNHWVRAEFGNFNVDMRICKEEGYGAHLLYLTGPKEFNIWIRHRAKMMGYKLNEYGLWESKKTFAPPKKIAGSSEEEIFNALGLSYIPATERYPRWGMR